VRLLKENNQKAEREGVGTSVESLNTLKSLQSSLRTISLELEKCPPETTSDPSSVPVQPQAKAVKSKPNWFPESVLEDRPIDGDAEEF
jgi:hypothetical protein